MLHEAFRGGEGVTRLTHLSLFSGIGGLDLAAEMAGLITVGQCEWADYPTQILEKHWPDVPRWRDIRTLTGESFYERTGLRTVDVVSGGFPCQPFSVAGERRGQDDDRYLWPEMLRVIRELRPTWIVGENVPGIINLALDQVLSDLEDEGYESQTFLIPACGVDAPHKRFRVAILAHAISQRHGINWASDDAEADGGQGNHDGRGKTPDDSGEWRKDKPGVGRVAHGVSESVYETDPDPDSNGLSGRYFESLLETEFTKSSSRERERERERERIRWAVEIPGMQSPWEDWIPEPGVDRVADGVPNRVDRLKCLGNAVVPQQFYPFFRAIYIVEGGLINDHRDPH